MIATVSQSSARIRVPSLNSAALVLGFAALAVPTLFVLADQSWSKEFGAYGPIVLVTGLWLLWRQIPQIRQEGRPGSLWLTAPILTISLALYVFGRPYDIITFEAAGVYGVALAILQSQVGARVLTKHWFPLLYLAFVIPLPGTVLTQLTSPLKQFVSLEATQWLHAFGIPVGREGVTIFVAQYQLLVEDACSGMNSIVGLIAVSLLYIYLIRGSSWVYALILTMFVIPIAIIANIVRIMILILLTFFFGNDVAQGYLHLTAGMILFATALLSVFGLDRLLSYAQSRVFRAR